MPILSIMCIIEVFHYKIIIAIQNAECQTTIVFILLTLLLSNLHFTDNSISVYFSGTTYISFKINLIVEKMRLI